MSFLKAINEVHRFTALIQAEFAAAIKAKSFVSGTPAAMVLRTIQYAEQSFGSVCVLCDRGDLAPSAAIVRSVYEAIFRIHWACIMPSGWDRVTLYWHDQDRKMANGLKHVPAMKKNADEILTRANSVTQSARALDPNLKSAPGFENLLKDVDAAEVASGKLSSYPNRTHMQYDALYRILSASAHGHPGVISEKSIDSYMSILGLTSGHIAESLDRIFELLVPTRPVDTATEHTNQFAKVFENLETALSVTP